MTCKPDHNPWTYVWLTTQAAPPCPWNFSPANIAGELLYTFAPDTGACAPLDAPIEPLARCLIDYLDPKVTEPHWACRIWRALQTTFSPALFKAKLDFWDWERLLRYTRPGPKTTEAQHLNQIYKEMLLPYTQQHFAPHLAARLRRALHRLMVLQLLHLPYHVGEEAALLLTLSLACRGQGLRHWREGDSDVFVITTEHETFLAWILERMRAFNNPASRDKLLRDLLWAALFDPQQADATPLGLRMLPQGEGVCWPLTQTRACAIVLESPWQTERGRRVARCLHALPPGVTPGRMWIWEPRTLTESENTLLEQHLTSGRALRYALLNHAAGNSDLRLIQDLRKDYLGHSPPVLQLLTQAFLDGRIFSEMIYHTPRGADLRAALLQLCALTSD